MLHTAFSMAGSGSPYIRYGYDGDLDRQTPLGPEGKGEATIDLIGLKAGKTVEWQVVAEVGKKLEEGPVRTLEVPPPPTDLAPLQLDVYDDSQVESGPFHVLTNVTERDDSFVVIIDRDGDYVWYARSRNPSVNIVHVELSADRKSVLWGEFDRLEETDFGGMFRLTLDGRTETFTPMPDAHHDIAELPDGQLAYLAFDIRSMEITDLDIGPQTVQASSIRTVAEGTADGRSYETLFAYADDYTVPPWFVCSHMSPNENLFGYFQWDHANSLMVDPVTDDLVVMLRNFDAITWIDPDTGAMNRQVGGLHGTPIADPATPFDHGHMTQLWDGGFMVFDNVLHGDGPSAMVEYTLDPATDVATEVWRYEDPEGLVYPVLSDADKLPGGNYLGTWYVEGRINEVTPSGDVVWQVETTDGGKFARASALGDLHHL